MISCPQQMTMLFFLWLYAKQEWVQSGFKSFILLESGFVFFLIICYLGFYNSYPRLAQIWVLTQLIPNGKTKKTWLWDLPSLEQACQASCLTAYINNHNLLSGYDKYKFSMQGIYKHHSSNVLLFDRKLEVLFQKKNQDEELPIYLPSPHF